jgi:hypothetical protein
MIDPQAKNVARRIRTAFASSFTISTVVSQPTQESIKRDQELGGLVGRVVLNPPRGRPSANRRRVGDNAALPDRDDGRLH